MENQEKLLCCYGCGKLGVYYVKKHNSYACSKNVFGCNAIKQKIKNKNIELYGVEYPIQNKIIAEKARNTELNRTDEQKQLIINRIKLTKQEKYGDEDYTNIQKQHETKLKRYGNKTFTNIEKIKLTKQEKYGDENYNNTEKQQQTMIIKYGKNGPIKTPESIFKMKNSLKEGYKTGRIQITSTTNGKGIKVKLKKYPNLFRSMWEAEFKIDNPIYKYEKEHGHRIQYIGEDGEFHTYIPDFANEYEIVEIKNPYKLKDFNNYKLIGLIQYCKEKNLSWRILSKEWHDTIKKISDEHIEYVIRPKRKPRLLPG
jgi:hypothetical protein